MTADVIAFPGTQPSPSDNLKGPPDWSADVIQMIELYRRLDPRDKARVRGFALSAPEGRRFD